jgi:hypothetical protein
MAFLGDFGNIFLGGAKTGDVGAATATFFGADPATAMAIRSTSQAAADRLSGPRDAPDVSTPPAAAGVDSPATLSQVSQTGRITPPGIGMRQPMNQAFIGGLAPLVSQGIGQAARLLSRPSVGGAVTGFGGAVAADFIVDMFGNPKKLVITRKLQREVKKVFQMSMGDINFVSANSMALFGKQLSTDQIFMIMFKTFKNQGPYVTRAAVRKTRSTIRKMEVLCDLKDRLAPPRRAAPRRRTMGSTTKVLQVK